MPQGDKVRVLFLDVDGVLHPAMCGIQLQKALGTEDSCAMMKLAKAENGLFRPRAMKCLARVLVCSGARVVLSSAWRSLPGGMQAVNWVLQKWGLPPVYSCTPGEGADRRVEHIWSWLAQHRDEVVGYAVVDDMDLSEESDATGFRTQPSCIAGHFVRTPGSVGLTSGHVSRLLAKLQKEPALPRSKALPGDRALPSLPPCRGATPTAIMEVVPEADAKVKIWPRCRTKTSRRLQRVSRATELCL